MVSWVLVGAREHRLSAAASPCLFSCFGSPALLRPFPRAVAAVRWLPLARGVRGSRRLSAFVYLLARPLSRRDGGGTDDVHRAECYSHVWLR